jgi:low affinity Fe/Cu permease
MPDASPGSGARPSSISGAFGTAAQWTARQCGRAPTFALAGAAVLVWAATGPLFGYSDTWQLVINTGTTIVTFLMVFLIQNTQNRDMSALHLKLDELIRVSESARNTLLDMDNMTEEDLERLKVRFARLAGGGLDTALLHDATRDLDAAGEEMPQ